MEQDKRTPTRILKDEHEVILRVLASFEGMLARVEAGESPDKEGLSKAVEFFRGFADGCHHAKEEDCLFPAMERTGLPTQGGPVGIMLEEHEQGRAYIREISRSLEEAPDNARRILIDNGWAYIQMLRAHIHKENEILFPLADKSIPPDAMEAVSREFEAAEQARGEGTHAHFISLAKELEAKAGV